MKKYNLIILICFLFSIECAAQSIIQGSFNSAGTTISDDVSGHDLNYSFGQPFGCGENSNSETLVIFEGLQGAIQAVSEGEGSGLGDELQLAADFVFNPSTGELSIRGVELSELDAQIIVSDLNGRVLIQDDMQSGAISLERLKHLPRQTIIVTLRSKDGRSASTKLIM